MFEVIDHGEFKEVVLPDGRVFYNEYFQHFTPNNYLSNNCSVKKNESDKSIKKVTKKKYNKSFEVKKKILDLIEQSGGFVSLLEIRNETGLSYPSVCKYTKDLEDDGYVVKIRSKDDKRCTYVYSREEFAKRKYMYNGYK